MQRDWGRKGGLRDPDPRRWTGPGIARERLDTLLSGFQGRRVLVVGDLMLDEYVWGRVNRISPEAPVMVVDVVETTHALGGAGNVVNNIQAMGASAVVAGVVGDDPNGLAVRERLRECGSVPDGVAIAPDRPTTVKTRIVAHSQQVVRVDRELRTAIPETTLAAVSRFVRDAVSGVDAVLLSDYSKGVLVDSLVRDAVAAARAAGRPVAANLKPPRVDPFAGATLLTLNVHEAERATGVEITDEPSLLSAGGSLRRRLECSALMVTRGGEGVALFTADAEPVLLAARRVEVYDVTGAGDTVISAATLALAAGGGFVEAAAIGNLAGNAKVTKLGVAPVTRDEIRRMAEPAVPPEGEAS